MLVSKIGRMSSLNRKQAVSLAVVGLISVALSGSYLVSKASSRGESTIQLSNDKKITIGQTRKSLVKALGSKLKVTDGAHYNYVSATGTVEAILTVLEDRLVAVRVVHNGENVQTTTGASVGSEIPLLRTKIGVALRPLPTGKVITSLYGYSWATPESTSFYFTNPCVDDGILASWAVAEKGSEALAVGQVKKMNCETR